MVITDNTVTSSHSGMVIGGGDFYSTTAGATNAYPIDLNAYQHQQH